MSMGPLHIVQLQFMHSPQLFNMVQFKSAGIYATTADTPKEYESISLVTTICYSGAIRKNSIEKGSSRLDNLNGFSNNAVTPTSEPSIYQNCLIDELMFEFIEKLKESGANGVIQLKIDNPRRYNPATKTYDSGLKISGLAIKLND